MSIGVAHNNSTLAIKEEVTEGTYVPEAAGTDFMQTLQDVELTPAKDLIEREVLTSDVEKVSPRVGQKSVTMNIPVELKASDTAGEAPETDLLYKALLGGKRQITSQVTTKAEGNTATELQIEDADIGDFTVGDIVLVLESGAYEVRPISEIDTTGGAASITFPFALDNGAPSASVVIEKATIYYPDSENAPTLSATRYVGGEIREKAIGCRVTSGVLNNFSTNQVANMAFTLEGLDWDREDGSELYTPEFDSNEPPVILDSCVWLDGTKVQTNSVGLTIENEIGFMTSTCSENGKIGSRITGFKVTGNLDPYMDDTDVSRFEAFRDNDDVSNTVIHNECINNALCSIVVSIPTGEEELQECLMYWVKKPDVSPNTRAAILRRLAELPWSEGLEDFFVRCHIDDDNSHPAITEVINEALQRHH